MNGTQRHNTQLTTNRKVIEVPTPSAPLYSDSFQIIAQHRKGIYLN